MRSRFHLNSKGTKLSLFRTGTDNEKIHRTAGVGSRQWPGFNLSTCRSERKGNSRHVLQRLIGWRNFTDAHFVETARRLAGSHMARMIGCGAARTRQSVYQITACLFDSVPRAQ